MMDYIYNDTMNFNHWETVKGRMDIVHPNK